MTVEERCYRILQDLGGTGSVAQIRTRIWNEGRVGHAMKRLQIKGVVARVSLGVYKIIREGCLIDQRGQSPRSQVNIRLAKQRKHNLPPQPKLELEKAWGWMPFSVATEVLEED